MIRPTLAHRIPTLDVLRGFAVLGILVANLPAFALPMASAMMGEGLRTPVGHELWAMVLTQIFVTGKFRSMLAILFGVGLWLQYVKRSAVPGNWPGGYLKRTGWLLILGLAHAVFLWYGDILAIYAMTAFVACFLVGLDDRKQQILIGLGYGLMLLAGVGMLALGLTGNMSWSAADMGLPPPAQELITYGQSGYLAQVAARGSLLGFLLGNGLFFVPFLLPLFVIGMRLAKSGVLAKPSAHPRTVRQLLWVGWGLGLPLNLVALLGLDLASPYDLHYYFEFLGGPVLALGYLTAGALIVERARERGRGLEGVAAVGRMALTSYLLQSVLATWIFYSWGLGWFGQADRAGLLIATIPVWAGVIAFALVWQRRFAMGPVEWAWRCLTEGRRLPLRRAEVVAEPEPPSAPPPEGPMPPAPPGSPPRIGFQV